MDIDEAEQVLRESSDHRLLRRVPPVAEWKLAPVSGPTRSALLVEIKATGANIETDQVMAIGLIACDYDVKSGAMVSVGEPIAFEDLDPTELEEIEGLLRDTQVVVAHGAAFVRPLAERLCPAFAEMNWACSAREIVWPNEGIANGRIDDLLGRMGWFVDDVDVATQARAGAFLMSLTLPRSEIPALGALLTHARRDAWLVRADDTAFETREAFKERDYHCDGRARAWCLLTETPQVEIAWLNAEIYPLPRDIKPLPMPATRRYSARRD